MPQLTLITPEPDGSDERQRPGAFRVRSSAKLMLIPGTRVDSDPDEILLERIARGDASALSAFVARKMPRLMSLGRRLLGDAAEAEDVAQETLLRTWKQASEWVPGKARIDTWMHRVALNLCYDRLRRRKDTVRTEDIEIVDATPGPSARLEQSQTARRLQQALDSLPERQKVAITLCYYQEMSNIDAAKLMGVSIEALESLLARARRGLRDLMREDNDVNLSGKAVGSRPRSDKRER